MGRLSDEEQAVFYSEIDVLALPSVNSLESFGMVQVEAMMCGAPVIASDLPGVRTVVDSTGMGLICRKSDVDDLVRCLEMIMRNKQEYIRPRDEIVEKYGIDQTIDKYMATYRNIL